MNKIATNYEHISVLLNEAVDTLNIRDNGIYIDATFGCGGHARKILSQLSREGHLIAIDCDSQAIATAKSIIDSRFTIIHGSFSNLVQYMRQRNLIGHIDGILFDLGVSSPQLDNPQRGFSFMRNGPLDMRMDPSRGISAAQWLLKAEINEITWVLKTFGEERFAKQLAHAIVKCNRQQPITKTFELAHLITNTIPWYKKHKHPATLSFQAIRIYLNKELEEITKALEATLEILAPQGRLSVISFHSLEDRIVKNFIRQHSRGQQIPSGLPLTEIQLHKLYRRDLKSFKKIMPSKKEVKINPRARSSVLRFAEKLY
ncbi:16S rRNA (cytosine(1402)-N(4))-methyltransferase RsmH [Candidatus Fukatsuia anoeciicola]|uniref:16S rRNA (cytosine(1402)-N(4))-methyltransferase RsmH n=1 Tax=Candidatus Fukatsuia anoeciicola TaxID=2994492 RepID=UPI0034641A0C